MIRIIGPRDKRDPQAINTTSRSSKDWSSGLSPFKLGPIKLYGGMTARIFENAWQFAKLYPEHADSNGEPTDAYWTWAKTGWNSNWAHRYPVGKGRKPLCSLWNGQRLDYITARKQIYLPLYQAAVRNTYAYRRLERTYRRQGTITLFDFDGYDHASINMSLNDVLNCPTKICGHAFILSMLLTYGPDFTIDDLLLLLPQSRSEQTLQMDGINQRGEQTMYPITVVNTKTFQGPCEYIGRRMPRKTGSPLGNPFHVGPGKYSRDEAVLKLYRDWLWKQMQDRSGSVYLELKRLATMAENEPLNLACWCAPQTCHGDIVKRAIEFLIRGEAK